MFRRTPIFELIEARRHELAVSRSQIARRCGYRNISKGLRRIESVCNGDLTSKSAILVLQALPEALDVSVDTVRRAASETAALIEEAESKAEALREMAWRAAFKPAAYLIGTESRPSQIAIFGMTGGTARWLRIPIDLSQPPLTFAPQAHVFVKGTPIVPFFGPTTGFIVNYNPDYAVRFGLDGNPVEQYDRAYRPGVVKLSISGRELREATLLKVMGVDQTECDVIK